MHAPFDAILTAPFGKVGVRADDAQIREIFYLPANVESVAPRSGIILQLAAQLDAYYDDADAPFDVPLAIAGTPFQQQVWRAICAVPRGGLTTYGDIARKLGSVARAVGQACGQNPLPIVIPCHRVVSASGIGGFSHHAEDGFHLEVKRWLLRHEGAMLL